MMRGQLPPKDARRTQGFSLTEMLATVLILVLLTGLVATGTQLAVRSYHQQLFESQAQVLSDSLNGSLSSTFRYMHVKVSDDGSVTYTATYDSTRVTSPVVKSVDGRVFISGTVMDTNGNASEKQLKLLNESVYGNCSITMDDASPTYETNADTGLKTYGIRGTYTITSGSWSHTYSFYYRALEDGASTPSEATSTVISPTVGKRPSWAERALTDELNHWWIIGFTWQDMTDASGVPYRACRFWYFDDTALVWFDGKYYKPIDQSGDDTLADIDPAETTTGEQFSVTQLGDGKYHTYQRGGQAVQWVLVTPSTS